MIPGELITADGDIELNSGRTLTTVTVANIGDRPIQVGSHYHFYEANEGLIFDREATLGFRLNIVLLMLCSRSTYKRLLNSKAL